MQGGQAPGEWEAFKEAVRQEFVPQDSVRRARDKLRRLHQVRSVAAYLTEFRNLIIAIPGMAEEEKMDRFSAGLKPQVRLEVKKVGQVDFNTASQLALNVYSAIFGAGMFMRYGGNGGTSGDDGTQPMDIGNVEEGRHYKRETIGKAKEVRDAEEVP